MAGKAVTEIARLTKNDDGVAVTKERWIKLAKGPKGIHRQRAVVFLAALQIAKSSHPDLQIGVGKGSGEDDGSDVRDLLMELRGKLTADGEIRPGIEWTAADRGSATRLAVRFWRQCLALANGWSAASFEVVHDFAKSRADWAAYHEKTKTWAALAAEHGWKTAEGKQVAAKPKEEPKAKPKPEPKQTAEKLTTEKPSAVVESDTAFELPPEVVAAFEAVVADERKEAYAEGYAAARAEFADALKQMAQRAVA